jgi:hypothetical protein
LTNHLDDSLNDLAGSHGFGQSLIGIDCRCDCCWMLKPVMMWGLPGCFGFSFAPGHYDLYPAVRLASGQHNSVTTGQTFQTDVSAKTCNTPFKTTARMGFT